MSSTLPSAPSGSRPVVGRRGAAGCQLGVVRVGIVLLLVSALVVVAVGVVLVARSWRARWLLKAPRERARMLYQAGRLDDAIAEFQRALRDRPHDPELLRGIARCYLAKRQAGTARGWAQRAAEHDATERAHVLLAEIEFSEALGEKLLRERVDFALWVEIDQLLGQRSTHLRQTVAEALAARDSKALAGSLPAELNGHLQQLAAYAQAAQKHPADAVRMPPQQQAELLKALAAAKAAIQSPALSPQQRSRVEGAMTHAQAALDRKGPSQDLTPQQKAHLERAAHHARTALRTDGSSSAAHRLLGAAEALRVGVEAGLAAVERAIEADPRSGEARLLAARLLTIQRKFEAALAQCRLLLDRGQARDLRPARLAADLCVRLDRYGEAIAILRGLLSKSSDQAGLRVRLAECYFDRGEFEKARWEAARAATLCGADTVNIARYARGGPSAYTDLSYRVHLVRGKALLELKEYADAVVDLRRVATHSRDARVHHALGLALLRSGQRAAARRAFVDALKVDPAMLPAREELAKMLAADGQLGQALEQYRAAIKALPDVAEVYERMAGFCESHGLHGQARQALVELFALRPAASKVAARVAELSLRLRDPEQGLHFARVAHRLRRGDARLLHLLARAEAANARYAAAARHFHQAVRHSPMNLSIYLDWAAMHQAAGQRPEAEEVYRIALRALPEAVQVRCAYASFCLQTAQDQQGVEELRRILRGDPRELTARVVLVEHYVKRGESAAALAEARQAVRHLPASVPAQALLAQTYRLCGKWRQFQATLREIAETAPDDFVAYQAVAAHVHEGQYEQAAAKAEEALQRYPAKHREIQLDLAVAEFLDTEKPEQRRKAKSRVRTVLARNPRDCDAGLLISLMQIVEGAAGTLVPACQEDVLPPAASAAWSDLRELANPKRRPKAAQHAARELMRAFVYDNAGWPRTAAETCQAILDDAPEALIARLLGATAWERAGERHRAIELCRQAIQRHPKCTQSLVLLGDLLLLDGQLQKANELYARAAAVERGSADAQIRHAFLCQALGDHAQAAATWRGILRFRDDDLQASNNLAWAIASDPTCPLTPERAREARAAVDEALAATRGLPDAPASADDRPAVLDSAGWLLHRLGDDAQAISLLSQAVKAAPYRGLYHFHLGMALARQDRNHAAMDALSEAIRLSPDGSFAVTARHVLARLRH